MPQLKYGAVNRSGVTARYWTHETRSVSCTASKDLKVRFSIAPRGGGRTDIQLLIQPDDLKSNIASATEGMPLELATTFTRAAHTAVLRVLAEKFE